MVEGNGKYLYEKGYGNGYSYGYGYGYGYSTGYGNGETNKALSFIKALLEKNYSFTQIASLLNLSKDEQTKYRTLLNL